MDGILLSGWVTRLALIILKGVKRNLKMSFAVKFNIVLGPLFQTGLQSRSRTDITLFTVLCKFNVMSPVKGEPLRFPGGAGES